MSTNIKKVTAFLTREGIGAVVMLVILFIFLSISSPYFLTMENISNLMLHVVFVMLAAFGMMFVLTMGGIDLSIGSIIGLSGGITGLLLMQNINMWVAILVGLAAGTIVGAINGILITRLNVAPFLVTFAMLNIARGLLLLLTIDRPIRDFATPEFKYLAQGYIFGVIPVPAVIVLLVFFICYFLLSKTSFGRYVVAIGSNSQAAYLSGVSVISIKIRVYALSGLLAAVSGVLLASRLTAVQPMMGTQYEMEAIAAAVIGGTSMAGGKGSVVGTAVGAIVLAVVSNGLDLLSVNQFYRMIITGLIIIIAVGVERFTASSADR